MRKTDCQANPSSNILEKENLQALSTRVCSIVELLIKISANMSQPWA